MHLFKKTQQPSLALALDSHLSGSSVADVPTAALGSTSWENEPTLISYGHVVYIGHCVKCPFVLHL